jgi:D-alanyl-D-alanine carboxypeptidase (penicillin-binding protein 5/6)
VTAPVSKGQKLGTLTVKAGDQILAQVNMVAETGVARLSWGDVFVKILRRLAMSKEG